jgi:GLPGLI family protein
LGNVFNNISYEVEEPIPIIDWSIYDVTKKFNSHHCIKATCSFRGRNYTVWFTTDIQTSFGPLKLHGLPGLILEANDDTNEVILRAKSISITEMKIKEQNPYLKVFSHKDVNDQIQKILDKLEESAKVISSKMDRGMKAKFEISRPKAIEMDFNFTPKKK